MRNIVLGVNCPILLDGTYTFDGNIAIAVDGKLVTVIAEERLSRKKYDGNITQSLQFALQQLGLHPNSLEAVVVCSFGKPTEDTGKVESFIKEIIREQLQTDAPIYYIKSHHEAHALTAASQCPFDDAIIAVLDNTGSIIGPQIYEEEGHNALEQTSYYLLKNKTLELIARDHDAPGHVGYGRIYSKVTRYIGFSSYQESGKTMGLAPFGNPAVFASCRLYEVNTNGQTFTTMSHDTFSEDGLEDLNKWFRKQGFALPEQRQFGERIRPFDMHIARWVQEQLQGSVAERLKGLLDKYKVRNVCISGGVALNSVMNHYLQQNLNLEALFIPPSPGDAGIAIGAVAWYMWQRDSQIPSFGANPYLGPLYNSPEIESAIKAECNDLTVEYRENPAEAAANALYENKIIAWYQGQSEYGPRALGNRSIIASPLNNWTKEILNHQVKQREWFRPYAPAIKLDRISEYFQPDSDVPYMMKVASVTSKAHTTIPSCVHVDGTARLQTVTENLNPLFFNLIDAFEDLTGIPIVLNTSFNLAGMPIVEKPIDAIRCFKEALGLSRLFLGNYEIFKSAY